MTKQEFIEKYHKAKTLKFEPPTFEEFMATKSENNWAHWFDKDISIIMEEENNKKGVLHANNQIDVFNEREDGYWKYFSYINEDGIDTREETYYKAVEYAINLFLED